MALAYDYDMYFSQSENLEHSFHFSDFLEYSSIGWFVNRNFKDISICDIGADMIRLKYKNMIIQLDDNECDDDHPQTIACKFYGHYIKQHAEYHHYIGFKNEHAIEVIKKFRTMIDRALLNAFPKL